LKEVNVITSKYNVLYGEWTSMYAMIGTLNQALAIIDQVDANEGEKNTIKAWIYFWKGCAYSRIGSMYVAGIINNEVAITNGNYVGSLEILVEANNNLQKANDLLILLSGNDDYEEIIADLIPSICKRGKGNPPTTDQWRRNINTLRARNLLVNTPQVDTNSEFWDEILTLTEDGVTAIDNTFTVRTDDLGNLLNTFVASDAIGPAEEGGGAYKISERFIQDYDAHDQRFLNNFDSVQAWIPEADRGNALGTRYVLVDEGKGIPDALVYCKKTIGEQELHMVGTYEENILMRAEAFLHKEQVDAGLALIDDIRNFQGAGLAPLAGSAISSDEAKQILRRERRVALAFRGFSFYDARRWGILENGRTGAVVVDFDGKVNTNAKIEYGYQGYWDVPIAESYYNPPAEGSAPIVNPDN